MKTVKTSISLPETILLKAQSRAAALGFTSLSAYLQHLVRKDEEENGKVPDSEEVLQQIVVAMRNQTDRIDKLLARNAEPAPLLLVAEEPATLPQHKVKYQGKKRGA